MTCLRACMFVGNFVVHMQTHSTILQSLSKLAGKESPRYPTSEREETMTSQLGSITHVALTVHSLDIAEAFYKDAVGMKELYRKSWRDDVRMDGILGVPESAGHILFLTDGAMGIEFFEFSSPKVPEEAAREPYRPGWMHICLRVGDIVAAYERLSAAGMKFNCVPSKGATGNWATYGRDPFGNLVELVQYASD